MSSAVTAGGTVNYLYNGLNQRVYKNGPTAVVSTGAAYYVYDEAGQLLGEYDAAGAPIYETIYLGSLPVGVMKQTGSAATGDIAVNLYNVYADHIATPRVITRQDHTIVWRWDMAEAFGGTAPEQDPSGLGVFVFNQRFPGQVFDSETGLFQNWNREYNARQGRYIQSDPIGLDGGINTFAYVEGDPLRYSDPTGLTPATPIAIAICAANIPLCAATAAAACWAYEPCRQTLIDAGKAVYDICMNNTKQDPLAPAGGKEHISGARPSTEGQHQAGQVRKKQDRGGEAGDESRDWPRRKPDGWKGPWPPKN